MTGTYQLIGSNASPYSRKLRAILRYRRIPHVWRLRRPEMGPEIESVRPKLVPMLKAPGESHWRVDSTPIAEWLEVRHPERSIIPPDPADAFLCFLIEDFADEWVTKWMFHHRWQQDDTATWAARWIAGDMLPQPASPQGRSYARYFRDRQRSRMPLVGCGEANAALLEAGYLSLLDSLHASLAGETFLFGTRPSLADFALYGQLVQLATDPWPQRLMRERAPLLESWLTVLDDASGLEGEWKADLAASRQARATLLGVIAIEYLPYLVANEAAVSQQSIEIRTSIHGHAFVQPPFAYQAKCYGALQQRWQQLPLTAQQTLARVFADCGIDAQAFA